MRRLIGFLALVMLAWCVGPGAVRACSPVEPSPLVLTRPVVEGAELRRESVLIRCEPAKHEAVCTVRAEYTLVPSVAGVSRARLVFGSSGLGGLRVTGGQLQREGDADEATWLSVYGGPNGELSDGWYRSPSVHAIVADVAVGAETTVAVEGRIGADFGYNGCYVSGIRTRHPVVSRARKYMLVRYYAAGSTPTTLNVDLPRGWRSGTGSRESTPGILGRRRVTRTITEAPDGAEYRFTTRSRFARGGPLIGAGIDLGDGPRTRLRAGYEFAFPQAVIYRVAVESDLRSATVVPALEVATPAGMAVIPSFGLGVGAPVRVAPDPRAGVRVVGTLSWPVVSIVGTFDAFPAQRGLARDFLGGLMLQLSI